MDIKYYVNTKESSSVSLLVTSRAEYWLNRVKLETTPPIGTEIFDLAKDIKSNSVNITFDNIDSAVFNFVVNEFALSKSICNLAIQNSNIEIGLKLSFCADHLIIGEGCNINMSLWSVNIREFSFLSLRTFKGIFPKNFSSIDKLTIWYINDKLKGVLELFDNISELNIIHGDIKDLNLSLFSKLEKVYLSHLVKLEKIEIDGNTKPMEVIITKCKRYIPSEDIKNNVNIIKF